jgi:hypothetical protein
MTVERYLHISTRVDTLADAWRFVMACCDEMSEPNITITPHWQSVDGFRVAVYDVLVKGTPT